MVLRAIKRLLIFFTFSLPLFTYSQEIKIKEGSKLHLIDSIKIYHTSKDIKIESFKSNLNNLKPTKTIDSNYDNWIVFELNNSSKSDYQFFLSTNFADSLQLYDFDSKKLIGFTGFGYSFNEKSRPIESGFIQFKIEPNKNKTIILQLKGTYPPKKIYFQLENAKNIITYDQKSYIRKISLIAVILSFTIFNFLIFLILKDKTYVYYVLYLVSLLLYLSVRTFVIQYNININTYCLDFVIVSFFLICFNISAINFATSYFRTERKTFWSKLFKWYKFLFLIPIILGVVYYKNYYSEPQNVVLALLSLTTVSLILVFSISNYSKKSRTTLLFLLAELPVILGGFFLSIEFFLTNKHLFERFGPYIFQISVILEILLFSFALGNRYSEQRMLWLNQVEENNNLKTQRLLEIQTLTEQKNKELEELVTTRTTQLNKTNKQLKRANEEKNKIFSILGHDLKSPLSSLQMMLDLFLTKDLDEEEFKELALSIKQQLKGLNDAIQNLFSWAQSQMKGEVLDISSFNLLDLIQDKANLLSIVLQSKQIQFSLHVNKDLMAFADKNQIGIVIQNLVNNAIKFTDVNGKIEINVALIVNKIEINIKDNGKGMSAELVDRIKNHQLIGSTKGTMGEVGTGLGLIICKEMLQKNNGELDINSKMGQGTNIKITIPSNPK
ncbi:MAG: sensor histidine kinase [Oligoflexus sp.]|nr:sensor histidine kinase [Pseudopedobacter sp.]